MWYKEFNEPFHAIVGHWDITLHVSIVVHWDITQSIVTSLWYFTSSLWYFNVHPKLQLQTHPIVKSKSWTLPRHHLCSADDDAVRPCCWSFNTISFFSGTLSDLYMYNANIIIFTIHSSCCDRQFFVCYY